MQKETGVEAFSIRPIARRGYNLSKSLKTFLLLSFHSPVPLRASSTLGARIQMMPSPPGRQRGASPQSILALPAAPWTPILSYKSLTSLTPQSATSLSALWLQTPVTITLCSTRAQRRAMRCGRWPACATRTSSSCSPRRGLRRAR